MTWTGAQLADLDRLWLQGVVASEIGRTIGKTKNAVVGMANRRGLPGRQSPIRKKIPASQAPVIPKRSKKVGFVAVRPLKLAKPNNRIPSCQWIEHEPLADDACKCGAAVTPGSPYCPAHHKRAYYMPRQFSDEGRAHVAAAGRRRNARVIAV